jgi:hypothetical protein
LAVALLLLAGLLLLFPIVIAVDVGALLAGCWLLLALAVGCWRCCC